MTRAISSRQLWGANWSTHKVFEAATIALGGLGLAAEIDAFHATRAGTVGEVVVRPKLTLEKLIESSDVRKAKPNSPTNFYDRSGGFEKALDDFNRLEGLSDVKPIEGGKHQGFHGKLPDGTKVSVRDGSRGRVSGKSESTLQLDKGGKSNKFRY